MEFLKRHNDLSGSPYPQYKLVEKRLDFPERFFYVDNSLSDYGLNEQNSY
jgi:hypothetical protein